MRERMPIAIRTVSNKAMLREAAYWAKLASLPGPSKPATEKPALTPALRASPTTCPATRGCCWSAR